mgnify:CR=1 FL=1
MMNIERANNVATIVTEKTGLEATAQEVRKGDFIQLGVTVGEQGSMFRPNIYVDTMKELSDEEIADKVIEIYEENKGDIDWDVDDLLDYNKVKQGLRLCIRPQTENKDDVKIQYLDLELYARYKLPINGDSHGSIVIRNDFLKKWDVTSETIIEDAKANTTDKYAGDDMQNILMAMMFGGGFKEMKPINDFISEITNDDWGIMPMYVIGTLDKMWGASILYNQDIFAEIARQFEDDVVIIPSSIHELIVVPKSRMNGDVSEMIREVNANEVRPEERLGDHPYFYDRELGQITF